LQVLFIVTFGEGGEGFAEAKIADWLLIAS